MKRYLVVLISLLLASCTAVKSKPISEKPELIGKGISYYLPMRLHRVKITANKITGDAASVQKAKQEYEKALVDKAKAQQEYSDEQNKMKKAEDISKYAEGDAKKQIEMERGVIRANILALKTALDSASRKAESSHDAYLRELDLSNNPQPNECRYNVAFSVEPSDIVPDYRKGYVASIFHSPFRDDHLTLTTTNSGLLSSADSVVTDRTSDIVKQIATAILTFVTPIPTGPAMKGKAPKGEPSIPCETSIGIDMIVDFSNTDHIWIINDVLKKVGMELVLFGYGIGDLNKQDDDESRNGLFYRRELPYIVSIFDNNSKTSKTVIANTLIFMPNLAPTTRLPFDTGLFVTSKQNATFNNGMLVSYNQEMPSEAYGLVTIPADLAKVIMSTVTDLIKFRVDYSSYSVQLAQKQAELIDALKALEERQNGTAAPVTK